MSIVLMLGSAPMAARAALWPRAPFEAILAINNAHAIRPDWTHHIHPHDFPPARVPLPRAGQAIVTETDFVPAQNALGGFVYAGATMAFTAAYWALHALRPRVIAAFGCDVIDHESGQLYGEVDDWQETGLQTLLEVRTPAVPLLIPLVPAICVEIRPADRLIRVTLPEGLAQLNDSTAAP